MLPYVGVYSRHVYSAGVHTRIYVFRHGMLLIYMACADERRGRRQPKHPIFIFDSAAWFARRPFPSSTRTYTYISSGSTPGATSIASWLSAKTSAPTDACAMPHSQPPGHPPGQAGCAPARVVRARVCPDHRRGARPRGTRRDSSSTPPPPARVQSRPARAAPMGTAAGRRTTPAPAAAAPAAAAGTYAETTRLNAPQGSAAQLEACASAGGGRSARRGGVWAARLATGAGARVVL